MPDADHLTAQEIGATLELKPAAMLCLAYAQWDNDKSVSDQITDLVGSLGHDRLYVRFHADPHPPGYAKKIGGPEAWGRLCAQRMEQYYGPLARSGVQLHAILANETDADYEGGLSVAEASNFYRRALGEYAAKRQTDIVHVPAPTGAPSTHRAHLEQYERDGWVHPAYWIDGHGYDGDLENVLNVLANVFPDHQYAITETNDLHDFGWPVELIRQGRVRDVMYFILNWARGGEGRVKPPSPDDAAKRMSLLRFPDRYQQFMALPPVAAEPTPEPEPVPEPAPPQEPPMPEPKSRDEVIAISNAVADEVGIPRLLMLACGIAESNLRWDARRPTDPAQDAAYWTDVSFGPWQQTVRWSQEYQDWYTNDAPGHPPGQFPGSDVIEAVFDHYRDTWHAARVAARQLKAHYRPAEDDAIWKALNRYNFPAGNGAPKSEGIGQNYRRGITEARGILGEPAPVPAPPEPASTRYEAMPAPQAGTIARCDGVIFHGSRSGRAGNPLDQEALGTARYCVSNGSLAWNATAGPGVIYEHLNARFWGWNARAASNRYVAVEIAQPTVNDDPTPCAVAVADWIYDRVWPVWGEVWHFPSHAELELWGETGQVDGKSDLYPAGDERMNVFREKVYAQIRRRQEAVPPAPSEPEPVPDPADPRDARIAELEAVAADRQRRIDELASLLGIARDDYADQLQTVVNSLRDLVPSS